MESDTVRTLKVNHSIIERRSLSFDLRSRKFERSYLIGGLLGRLGIMDTETLAVPEKGYTSSHNSCLRVNVCSKNGTIPANSQVIFSR
nr:hypothetical protein [Tanacetum cinerariifolium]